MSDFITTFFGPLDKNVCSYFLILSMIFFFSLIVVLGMEVFFTIRHFKELNVRMATNGVLLLFNIFIAYFINRVFYNMCTKTM
jgi:hypothetical protein